MFRQCQEAEISSCAVQHEDRGEWSQQAIWQPLLHSYIVCRCGRGTGESDYVTHSLKQEVGVKDN